MREYTIVRRDGAVNWSDVPELAIDTPLWGTRADVAAWAQLCWGEEALHVRLRARERAIRAEHDSPVGMPCEDSCLEFFFSPVDGDERYFNIEFNPNCCMYLGLGGPGGELVRLLPEHPCFAPEAARTLDGWELRYRVPFAFVRHFFPAFSARSGLSMRANCFKCGDLTPEPHYFSWNPCSGPTPNFHQPADFGRMRLA